MITEKQKKEYLEYKGSRCPFCKSNEIEGYDGYDGDGDWISAKIECSSCGKQWIDIYTITDIIQE